MAVILGSYEKPELWYRLACGVRKRYTDAVDQIVLKHAQTPMLDVGTADGVRAANISQKGDIDTLVLVEPTESMFGLCKKVSAKIKIQVKAEDLDLVEFDYKFATITCLWNTLGEIAPEFRQKAIDNLADLLSDSGKIILDTSNRYNIRHYGWWNFFRNLTKDVILPHRTTSTNGDFSYLVKGDGYAAQQREHFFTPFEVAPLFKRAGLKIIEKHTIDYETGESRGTPLEGHFVYVLGKK